MTVLFSMLLCIFNFSFFFMLPNYNYFLETLQTFLLHTGLPNLEHLHNWRPRCRRNQILPGTHRTHEAFKHWTRPQCAVHLHKRPNSPGGKNTAPFLYVFPNSLHWKQHFFVHAPLQVHLLHPSLKPATEMTARERSTNATSETKCLFMLLKRFSSLLNSWSFETGSLFTYYKPTRQHSAELFLYTLYLTFLRNCSVTLINSYRKEGVK